MPICSLLESFNISPSYKDPRVNAQLSSIPTLIKEKQYFPGTFILRILNRFHIVDDFRFDGIAAVRFDPIIRKINLTFNPLLLWDFMLRDCVKKTAVEGIDGLMIDSFKMGGWSEENFKKWIEFCLNASSNIEEDPFSYSYSSRQKKTSFNRTYMSIVIHEILHCLWNHTHPQRKMDEKNDSEMFTHKLSNVAQDFAINQTLDFGNNTHKLMTTECQALLKAFYEGGAPLCDNIKIPLNNAKENDKKPNLKNITIDWFDHHSFLNQPYEYYFNILNKAKKETLEQLIGKGLEGGQLSKEFASFYDMFKHDLEEMSKEELEGLLRGKGEEQQFEDFNSMNSDMKKVAMNDMKRVIDEMLEKGEIENPEDICQQHPFNINKYFAKVIEGLYKTDTISWEHVLQHFLRKAIGYNNKNYTMKRESRSIPNMFPGKEYLEGLDVILVTDVSGSINMEDYNRFVNEMEKLDKVTDQPKVRYIQFHHEVSLDTIVPTKKIRSLGIKSTGGTALTPVLELMKKEGNQKLVVVFTDGYIEDTVSDANYNFPVLMFVSSSGCESTVEGLRKRFKTVIHQDGKNENI